MAKIHWALPVSGNFDTAADWGGGVVPGAADDAILDAAGSKAYAVSVTTDHTVNGLQTAADATLAVSGAGITLTTSSGTDGGTSAGTISIADAAAFGFDRTFSNSGQITLNSAGDATTLIVGGSYTVSYLTGGGAITLGDNADNIIRGYRNYDVLTNVDNVISGAGKLGDGAMRISNEAAGVIVASGAKNPLIIECDIASGYNHMTNAGRVEATGAGGLVIKNTLVQDQSSSGVVSASQGSSVTLDAAIIFGGLLTGPGAFRTVGVQSGLLSNPGYSITNAAHISIGDGTALSIDGQTAIVNTGLISLDGKGAETDLIVGLKGLGSLTATLSGGGSIVMSEGANRIYGRSNRSRLVNVDNTISGSGLIGMAMLTLVNGAAGVIDANGKLGIVLNTHGRTSTNDGLIEATGAGSLIINGTTIDQGGGGRIVADGAPVTLHGSQVLGGRLETLGVGVARVSGAGNAFNGKASELTLVGDVRLADGGQLTLHGVIHDTGILSMRAGTRATTLVVGLDGASLTGGGQLVLDDRSLNRVVGDFDTSTLANVNDKIRGSGTIGNAQLRLVNEAAGLINGGNATALILDTGTNTIDNAGLIAASGAGGVTIRSVLANSGVLAAAMGDLTVQAAVTGTGRARINGATLDLLSSFSQDVSFGGGAAASGVLELAQSQGYAAVVSGFSTSGKTALDLVDIAFTGPGEATFASHVLTVTDGTHSAHITLNGDYRTAVFTASDDGHGGTRVVAHAFAAAMASLAGPAGTGIGAVPPQAARPALLAAGR